MSQAPHDAAFGLRRQVSRLHRDAGVDRSPEIVHLDLAAGAIDRDFGDARGERIGLFVEGDAEGGPVALALPIGHFSDSAQQGPPRRPVPAQNSIRVIRSKKSYRFRPKRGLKQGRNLGSLYLRVFPVL
jgi:hypothetical protein